MHCSVIIDSQDILECEFIKGCLSFFVDIVISIQQNYTGIQRKASINMTSWVKVGQAQLCLSLGLC